ncbi:P pilus assembly protein, pilin FimA [Serratia proteamaculans]|uniref:fimbrial protein n=1 Tax=Serratia proteamaculans TaxID=28151 RepID=UPI002182D84E|nr:hypothetical protein [Serratia proteamaculans]CAI2536465.1 P pilus assembly protein, pilin FimA [Serratia proteamaculans]
MLLAFNAALMGRANTQRRQHGGMVGVACLLSSLVTGSALAAETQTITFNITVPAATCTVTPNDLFISAPIDGSTFVGQNWKTGGENDLTVALSNCSGDGASGKSPKLTIAPAGGTAVLAGSNNFLFRDSGSTSQGFGVAIFNKSAANITKNATTDMVASSGVAWTGTSGASGSSLNGKTITLSAGIACGPTAYCTTTSLVPGILKASITFNLVYN